MEKATLIGPFKQIITMAGLPLKGALTDSQLQIIKDGGIIISGSKITGIGDFESLKETAQISETITLKGNHVCMPGFVDAHTHICFGGSRAKDYAMRNAGKTYLEIAHAGGGIWDTVTQTRKASQEELVTNTIKRANRHLKNGTTTIEVKSGYGLSVPEELKMLRAIKEANNTALPELISTCLAAHMLPKDFKGTEKEYLEMISDELFPILKEENLTHRMDAFIEQSAFSADDIQAYFSKATDLNFDITVHADQFSTSGSKVAVDHKAISADHLEASTEKEIALLAKSDTIAVALPGASIGLGCDFTPARKLLNAGASLAIASDHNPGSAPMGDLLTQASILGTFEKLTNAEVLAGITFRAAAALKLDDRGKLEAGLLADFAVFHSDNYQDILYNQGNLKPCMVWKSGELVFDKHK
ncbi:imidazolonepropionase [Maribacter hydrothermalis]|uniref:Imidazolonepropionase n=1 Tax=Maribacter hydrothermalis TaxID=1836467 RepID=A0A1B7ZF92_9FLAO|nr:imidazolonepropionase [Maribacter hydrothermalis]APQ17736.1 imidazolonepropionase [Maribacter hydrothermalis]OBR42211.1 imidazolonepropionase [Maribacter hydrothermalis]